MVVGELSYIGFHTVLEPQKENYNVLVINNLSNSYQSVLYVSKLWQLSILRAKIGTCLPSISANSIIEVLVCGLPLLAMRLKPWEASLDQRFHLPVQL